MVCANLWCQAAKIRLDVVMTWTIDTVVKYTFKKYLNTKYLFKIVFEIQNPNISLFELRSHNTQLFFKFDVSIRFRQEECFEHIVR